MRFVALLLSLALWLPAIGAAAALPQAVRAAPAEQGGPPVLTNPGFECGGKDGGYHDQAGINGMVPNGWTGIVLAGPNPKMCSTQMLFGGSCTNDTGYEKIEGLDSYVMLGGWNGAGQDFLSPPFDVVLYQQAAAEEGTDYSVSGWLTSLCGGSASPNDCPAGYYISKQVGMDPSGGTDPRAPGVQWIEDLRPHTTAKWVDLSVGARAQGITLTVFVRVNSPFQHHGNLAFADAVKLVRAPTARLNALPAQTDTRILPLAWSGALSDDIPSQTYRLYYDLQYRLGANGSWQNWWLDAGGNSTTFFAAGQGQDLEYYFRLRARAEQPDRIPGGAYPNHRFAGAWTEAGPVRFGQNLPDLARLYLPAVLR